MFVSLKVYWFFLGNNSSAYDIVVTMNSDFSFFLQIHIIHLLYTYGVCFSAVIGLGLLRRAITDLYWLCRHM